MAYNILKQAELFERIAERIAPGNTNAERQPQFTLILGSGFSYGIIPTTAQIVQQDLSWWKWCQRAEQDGHTPDTFRQTRQAPDDATTKAKAREFWERVLVCHRRQPDGTTKPIQLDANGVPDKHSVGEAYRFALSPQCTPGLCEPNDVRRYFGDLIRRAGRRLNPAHLFLASIIAENPRLFGTIFTTNFAPLLQRALQLVNAPFFVSDRPETLQSPDDDDVFDAVHLIHAHGRIYRYLLVNSPTEIERYAAENQPKLQEYFRKHAVLIVGFSGWDDAITRALKGVTRFDRSLYWLDWNADANKSSLSADAREILEKHENAYYVPIKSADDVMVQLHRHLTGHALPRLFREPILLAREQLDTCDLNGVKLVRDAEPSPPTSVDAKLSGSPSRSDDVDLGNEIESVSKRLDAAQDLFTGKTSTDPAAILLAEVRQRFAVASDHYLSDRYVEALTHLEYVVANAESLDPAERALAFFRRGFAYGQRGEAGDVERAIEDYTTVIDMPDAPAERKARARVRRGITYRQRGETGDLEREIADYTAVIDMPDAPVEQKALARFSRGWTYGLRGEAGDVERAIADYTAVIDMPDAAARQKAMTRVNRGFTYGQRHGAGDVERAIADYTAVIDMPEAPAERKARARVNRGFTYGQRGGAGNVERAIADYTAVIDMPEAPAEQKALARVNRGVAYDQRGEAGDVERAIADYTAVIDMLEVPAEQKALARVNRGATYGQRGEAGDVEREIADYTAVIDMPEAHAEQKADASINRGITYDQRGEAGDVERAIADYTAVIDMPDASAEQKERARFNRDLLPKPRKTRKKTTKKGG
jgi:tetratricopeptide (TPR) repeat protein